MTSCHHPDDVVRVKFVLELKPKDDLTYDESQVIF
jgi:hypothetical protein